MKTVREILTATREHAVAFENRDLACLKVSGTDGLDLLHRLSTNDLLSGTTPRVRQSILTTEKGRIVDLIRLVVTESGIRMLVSANARQKVTDWVEKFTITEDITFVDLSSLFSIVYVVGIKSFDSIQAVLGLPELTLCFEMSHQDFGPLCFWREDYAGGSARILLLRKKIVPAFLAALEARCVTTLNHADECETLRLLAGEPAYGHELTEQFNPLELGLRTAVSFTKGCYVGQEVIARLDSYDKVQRELVSVELSKSPFPVNVGDDLLIDGEPAGVLTSIAPLPFADGRRRGIAVVHSSQDFRSTEFIVRSPDGITEGEIVQRFSLEDIGEGKG